MRRLPQREDSTLPRGGALSAHATHKYGNLYTHMKTTIELPDDLFVAAKRRAAEDRTTLRALVERGLRAQLRRQRAGGRRVAKPAIAWVTADGGLPDGLDVSNRAAMTDWLRTRR